MENMITPQNVADKLGVTVYRVHQMIREGKLNARAYGRFYLIAESDLASVLVRPRGRPKKEGAAEGMQAEAKGPTSEPTKKTPATRTAAQKKAISAEQLPLPKVSSKKSPPAVKGKAASKLTKKTKESSR